MDVDAFITKYRPEWERLDKATKEGSRGLSKLSGEEIQDVIRLYLRASSNLAELRTSYHDLRLESYLTGVVARAHSSIYSSRSRTTKGFLRLMGQRYREAILPTTPFMLIATLLLVGSTVLTLLWVANSPEAGAGLIPPQAREAIRRFGGQRANFGISSAGLSTIIFINNVKVAFMAFAFGISFGVGTIYVLILNGFLIGALAAGFHVLGKAQEFWGIVVPHGLLEITAICISAGAGLRIGWSIIDPGERLRVRALSEESRESVVVIAGVVPAFLVAALIEGFISGTSIPSWVQLAVGGLVWILYLLFLFGWGALRRSQPSVSLDP